MQIAFLVPFETFPPSEPPPPHSGILGPRHCYKTKLNWPEQPAAKYDCKMVLKWTNFSKLLSGAKQCIQCH